MVTLALALTPIDTWFFRSGTPFDQGAAAQDGVESTFPPSPSTVAGALRAALARSRGWRAGPWGPALVRALGDGPALGPLSMMGPFVLRAGEPVFPLPRHLLAARGDDGRWEIRRLAPGPAVECDLGVVRLPTTVDGRSSGKERDPRPWITAAGLRRILAEGSVDPDEVVDERNLWVAEPRVGIQRSADRRTVEDGMLYSTRHVRLREGVALGATLDGIPAGWALDGPLPLGGEARFAAAEPWSGFALECGPSAEALASGHLTLIALTPLRLARGAIAGTTTIGAGLRVMSACTGRALRIGGWDSREDSRGPLALTSAVAPGATLFCKATAVESLGPDVGRGLIRIGRDTAAGYGLCAVAHHPWKEIP